MKRTLVLSLVTCHLSLFAAGCGTTSQDRIEAARQAIPLARDAIAQAGAQIEQTRAEIAQLQLVLADPNLAGELVEKGRAALAALQSRLTWLFQQRTVAEQVLAGAEAVLAAGPQADATLGDEMIMLGELLVGGSSHLSGEAKAYVALAGTVLTMLGGLFGRSVKRRISALDAEARENKTAVAEIVQGGEVFKRRQQASAPEDRGEPVADFKDAQQAMQSARTRELVALARIADREFARGQ